MKNLLAAGIRVKTAIRKIYSLENIFSNQWILIYPMQAVPAILYQMISKITIRKRVRF